MSLRKKVSCMGALLRACLPPDIRASGGIALVALLPRRVADDEIDLIVGHLIRKPSPIDDADIGVDITRITHEMPSRDDIERVQHRLDAVGRSAGPEAELS